MSEEGEKSIEAVLWVIVMVLVFGLCVRVQ